MKTDAKYKDENVVQNSLLKLKFGDQEEFLHLAQLTSSTTRTKNI